MPAVASAVLDSRITGVTVYRGWARIERAATLPPGGALPQRVALDGLPLALDDATVQVRVEAADGGGAVPLATDLRVSLDVPPAGDAPPSELSAAVDAARRELERLRHRLGRVEEERAWFEELSLPERPSPDEAQAPPPSPLEARRALLDFQQEQVERLVAEERTLAPAIEAAETALAKAQQALRVASSAATVRPDALHKRVEVGLAVAGAGAVGAATLAVSYLVPGVRWAPTYRLEFDAGFSRARLALRAAVCQRTGEDWTDVRLTLSTAHAMRWTELPELSSVRIGRRQPPPASLGWREPPQGAELLYHDHDRRFGGPAEPPPPPRPADLADLEERSRAEDRHRDKESADRPKTEALAELDGLSDDAFGGMAPMEAMECEAPPAPSMAPAPSAKGAPARPMRRQEAKKMKMASAPRAARGPGGAGGSASGAVFDELAPSPEPEADFDDSGGALTAAEALLDYAGLRLGAPEFTTRGRLQPADTLTRYLEALPAARQAHAHTLWQVLGRAQAAAAKVADQSLPPGCDDDLRFDGFDHAYPADAPVSLPSDGQFHTVPLAVREGDCEQRFIVVPRESKDVFRYVEWANPLDAPLLRGPVDVHVAGDYLLTSALGPVPARGTGKLGLGVDQSIVVARNTRYHEDAAGMLRGSLELHHHIGIEVRNNGARPAKVEVQERVPVTTKDEDDITVTLGEVEPPWATFVPGNYSLRGAYRWTVTVPPGGVQTLQAAYVVKISAKHELTGGNRREA